MFRHTKKSRRSAETRALKLRLESLEERQLLTAVGWEAAATSEQVPYGSEFCASAERCESAVGLTAVQNDSATTHNLAESYSILKTTEDKDKSFLTVTSISDPEELTPGTLRYAIANAEMGDKITFDSSLQGGTINLNGTELTVNKAIMIDASALYDKTTNTHGITINAGGNSRVATISAASVVFNGLTLTGGYSRDDGGGVYVRLGGNFMLTNGTISGNTARNGGGVYVGACGNFTLTNGTISGNTAGKGGGVFLANIGNTYSNFTLTNGTISGNTADRGGGVFLNHGCKIESYNSIIALNTGGEDIFKGSGSITGTNNLSTYVFGGVNYKYDSTMPLFVDAENGDYSLSKLSQAIDKGDNQKALDAGLTIDSTDIAGNPRFGGSLIDIGAYEYYEGKSFDPTVVDTFDDSSDPNDGEWSLREAIAYAAEYATDDVTIRFDSEKLDGATITLAKGELSINKSIKIDASDLSKGITINADQKSRIFNVTSGVDVEINGVTFVKGKAGSSDTPENGGAIYNAGSLTLNGVTFQINEATKNGGAIFNDFGATLTINGGCFSSNSANNGGAFANYGTLEISDSEGVATTISENSAECFGGAYFGCGELTVGGKTFFTSNDAGLKGGAIYNDVNKSDVDGPIVGVVTINGDDVSFVGNTAGERGGAIQTYSTLNIGGTATFSGNKASGDEVDKYGGAIDVGKGGSATLSGALTFNGNAADFGGAIFSVGALMFQVDENDGDCYTFTDNSANKSGGAIDALAGTLSLGGSFTFIANEAKGDHDFDSSGVGGAIATTIVSDAEFVWKDEANPSKKNSAAWGNCVAFKDDCGISAQTFGLDDATDYVIFNELVEKVNPSQSLLPRSISPNAVEASITVEGVKTTFGAEGVTPQQLGLGVGTHEALVQYVDANGETSAAYILKLTVAPGASVEVRETGIADGKGVKFDFNLNKECGRAVSVWEISWGDGSTTRAENLSESWMAAHYYAQDGTFDVSLNVVYIDGTSETFEAFSTQKIGTTVAKTEARSAVFEDVDDLFEDAFVDFENPNVYGPAFLR